MAGSQKGSKRTHNWADAILAVEAMERLNMNATQLGVALGYNGGSTVGNWIRKGKMPATAARALESLYHQRIKPPGAAIPAATTDQPVRVIRLSHDAEDVAPIPAPRVAPALRINPPPQETPAPASAIGATDVSVGFYVCTRFVNDKAVWRTTVSPSKTMVMNGKTYLMVPL